VASSAITSATTTCRFTGTISGTTLSVSKVSSGSLAKGNVLQGLGVQPGTIITALESVNPSTGVGTYTINQAQTLSSSTALQANQLPAVRLLLPAAVVNSLTEGTPPPSFTVSPETQGNSNVVADEQFSSQSGQAGTGVYLAAGQSDQLPLSGAMGAWAVQNRVVYATPGQTNNVVYLNGYSETQGAVTSVAPPTLEELYKSAKSNQATYYSAASTPTAIGIAGPTASVGQSGSLFGGDTFVAWVEAGKGDGSGVPNQDPQ
jgi:hypothetical protein